MHQRILSLSVFFLVFWAGPIAASGAESVQLVDGSKIVFLDASQAAKRLGQADEFTSATGDLERQFRLQSRKPISEDELLLFAGEQAVSWSDGEMKMLREIANTLRERIAELKLRLSLPSVVHFIKTTGREEGGAAYCRGTAVVFSEKMMKLPKQPMQRLVAHELFHILSRSNAKTRDELFQIIGFKRCGRLNLPTELSKKRLTNPDAPVLEHYIQISHQGMSVSAVPVTFLSTDEYRGGNMFSFLQFQLLAVDLPDGDGAGQAVRTNVEGLTLIDPTNASFMKQVGRNTNYIIHPEEIMADNFAALLMGRQDLPDPAIVEKMASVLRHQSPGTATKKPAKSLETPPAKVD